MASSKAKVKKHLQSKMVKYSSAATAAMALTGHAGAAIVIPSVEDWSLELTAPNDLGSFSIDLNGDSINDFTFAASRTLSQFYTSTPSYISTYYGGASTVFIPITSTFQSGLAEGLGAGTNNPNRFATTDGWLANLGAGVSVKDALAAGDSLLPAIFFTNFGSIAGEPAGGFFPSVDGSDSGFVGVAFDVGGIVHYGWLELLVSRNADGAPQSISVLSAAYQDVGGEDIMTGAIPEPKTVAFGLGLLALGAAGVRSMRQRRSA